MKKVFTILILLLPLITNAQNTDFLNTLFCYEIKVDGVADRNKADYLVRSLEKQNLIIFGAYSVYRQKGYLLLSDKYQLSNITTFTNYALNDYKLIEYNEVPLTEDLFLEIYEMRNEVNSYDKSKKAPEYIQLGPNNELSVKLYDRAKMIWSQKYTNEQMINGKIDFANKGRLNEYYRAIFELDKQVDAQMLEEIHNALKESDKITDVNRCGDVCFEIYSYEEIYPEYVENIILQYGVNISERSLTEEK